MYNICVLSIYKNIVLRVTKLRESKILQNSSTTALHGGVVLVWQYTVLTCSFPNLESVCCSMSSSNCCFLTCIQISQEADQVVWYSHLCQNFPQFVVIHTVNGFGIVNKSEVDILLELSCFLNDPMDVGNLISGSSDFCNQLEHLEVHSSCTVKAWLGEFWALLY